MSRLPELVSFAQKHNLKIGTIGDLIAYRRRHDNLVRIQSESTIMSEFGGTWKMRVYVDETHGDEHIVLCKGDISGETPVLVRMHAMDPMLDIIELVQKGAPMNLAMPCASWQMRARCCCSPARHVDEIRYWKRSVPQNASSIWSWCTDISLLAFPN